MTTQAILNILNWKTKKPKFNKEMDKWISVKEKAPEFGISVFVYQKNISPPIKISTLHAIQKDKLIFVVPFSGCITEEFNVHITHWQPLPSPPKP